MVHFVAALEPAQVDPEELVVYHAAIPHPEHHSPPPLVRFQEDNENHGKEHVPDIPEHNPDEQSECDDVKRGWVEFLVGWNSVCIDDFLRKLYHLATQEQRGWGFFVLFDIYKEGWDIPLALLQLLEL